MNTKQIVGNENTVGSEYSTYLEDLYIKLASGGEPDMLSLGEAAYQYAMSQEKREEAFVHACLFLHCSELPEAA